MCWDLGGELECRRERELDGTMDGERRTSPRSDRLIFALALSEVLKSYEERGRSSEAE